MVVAEAEDKMEMVAERSMVVDGVQVVEYRLEWLVKG